MLELMQQVFYGPTRSSQALADVGPRETLILLVLALLVVALGLFPQAALDSARPSLDQLIVRDMEFDPADPGSAAGRVRTAAARRSEPIVDETKVGARP